MSDLIEIGALWKGQKEGVLTGSFGNNARIIICKNQYKEKDNHPDYKILIAPREKDDRQGGGGNRGGVGF